MKRTGVLIVVLGALISATPALAMPPDVDRITIHDEFVDPFATFFCEEEVNVIFDLEFNLISYADGTFRRSGTVTFAYSDLDGNSVTEHLAFADFTELEGGEVVETEHGVLWNLHYRGGNLVWAGTLEINWTTGTVTFSPFPWPIDFDAGETYSQEYVDILCGALGDYLPTANRTDNPSRT